MADPIKLEAVPIGGLNRTDNYARLAPTEVMVSVNVLFERRKLVNRPGLSTAATTGVTHAIVFAETRWITIGASTPSAFTFAIDTASNLFLANGGSVLNFGAIPPTAGALAFGTKDFNNMAVVIGVLLIGNNPAGLICWDITTAPTYDIIAAAPYRYVAGHVGRAVAAYKPATSNGAIVFAWSKPGDVRTWTSTDGSAGEEFIADCPDEITGLGTLHNIVVVLRQYGIHLAYPTGQLPLPYNMQSFTLKGGGCFYPASAAWDDQVVYFVGKEDVFMFDLQAIIPIGGPVKDILISLMQANLYRGFITRNTVNGAKRLRYNLVPINQNAFFHFVYDVQDKVWSFHAYGISITWGFTTIDSTSGLGALGSDLGPFLINTSTTPSTYWWDDNVACESTVTFTKYMETPDQTKDYKVVDLLVRTEDHGAANLTCSIYFTLGATETSRSSTRSIGNANTGDWIRTWLTRNTGADLIVVGNDFKVQLTAAAGHKFALDYLALLVQEETSYLGY